MRLDNIIVIEIGKDKLHLEEDLQRVVNSDLASKAKVKQIKKILKEIVVLDNMLAVWRGYVQPAAPAINNNEEKQD